VKTSTRYFYRFFTLDATLGDFHTNARESRNPKSWEADLFKTVTEIALGVWRRARAPLERPGVAKRVFVNVLK
jgi:hypothetical protein